MEIYKRYTHHCSSLLGKDLISGLLLISVFKYFYVYLYFFMRVYVCIYRAFLFMWVMWYHSTHIEVKGQNPGSVPVFHTVGSSGFTATWIRLTAPWASRLYLLLLMRWNYRTWHYAYGFYRVLGLQTQVGWQAYAVSTLPTETSLQSYLHIF